MKDLIQRGETFRERYPASPCVGGTRGDARFVIFLVNSTTRGGRERVKKKKKKKASWRKINEEVRQERRAENELGSYFASRSASPLSTEKYKGVGSESWITLIEFFVVLSDDARRISFWISPLFSAQKNADEN